MKNQKTNNQGNTVYITSKPSSTSRFYIDFSLLVKILVEDNIFEFEVEYDIKETKFVNLFIYGSGKIWLGSPLKEYQYQIQDNWKTGLVYKNTLFIEYDTKDSKNEDLDEKVDENLDRRADKSL